MTPDETKALIKEMKISFPTRDDFRAMDAKIDALDKKIDAVKADTVHITKLDEELIPVYDRLKALEEHAGIGGEGSVVSTNH